LLFNGAFLTKALSSAERDERLSSGRRIQN